MQDSRYLLRSAQESERKGVIVTEYKCAKMRVLVTSKRERERERESQGLDTCISMCVRASECMIQHCVTSLFHVASVSARTRTA